MQQQSALEKLDRVSLIWSQLHNLLPKTIIMPLDRMEYDPMTPDILIDTLSGNVGYPSRLIFIGGDIYVVVGYILQGEECTFNIRASYVFNF